MPLTVSDLMRVPSAVAKPCRRPAMIDGRMQDAATWQQAKVIVDLARLVAARDPALATAYGFRVRGLWPGCRTPGKTASCFGEWYCT